MKNLLNFYMVILVPLGIIFLLNKADFINGTLLVGILLFYALVYRTYTDGKRLADKKIIQKKDIWKMILPGKRFEHFRELYLK
ncbi:hypothetical protein BST97_05935 [Nonlabens spongiae]|uniref:Uncharacterized protein n=1 Tax=Nonlabens spongiae TaxID=331648 RepID=A0A1W6MIX7_9FLAO|nr:hypothetical protein [Nonlabens spongiae]ARN77565.1 hypothetical protein BST97_05935 [Nonlabens spongiae]